MKPVMKVIGVGGAGNHIVGELFKAGINDCELVAVNTDAMALLEVKIPSKILVGKSLTGGKGTGNDVSLAERCIRYDVESLSQLLEKTDVVFLTCGMGSGTGSGVTPFLAELAKSKGVFCIAIVTMPFKSEGRVYLDNAEKGLTNLKKFADGVIVISNDRLLPLISDIPLGKAFQYTDKIIADLIHEFARVVTEHSTAALGIADLRSILHDGVTAMIGVGVSDNALDSVQKALKNPLIDFDVAKVSGALISIAGEVSSKDVDSIAGTVSMKINPDANILCGTQSDGSVKRGLIKTILLLTHD